MTEIYKLKPHNEFSCTEEYKALYGKAILIANKFSFKKANGRQCLSGQFDVESLRQAAVELGYISKDAMAPNLSRQFAEDFKSYTNHGDHQIDTPEEFESLQMFEEWLEFKKNVEAASSIFVLANQQTYEDLRDEQWELFKKIFVTFTNDVVVVDFQRNHSLNYPFSEVALHHLANKIKLLKEFYSQVNLDPLSKKDVIAELIKRLGQESFEILLTNLLSNLISENQKEAVDRIMATYLTEFKDQVSPQFFVEKVLPKLSLRTAVLQNAFLGAPNETPGPIYSAIIKKITEPLNKNLWVNLVYRSVLLGHEEAYEDFKKILTEDINHPLFQTQDPHASGSDPPYVLALLGYNELESTINFYKTLGLITNNEPLFSITRSDLKEKFQKWRDELRVLVPELYRTSNVVAVLALVDIIRNDQKDLYQRFEDAYKIYQTLRFKSYAEPDFTSLSDVVINNKIENEKPIILALEDLSLKWDKEEGLQELQRIVNTGQGGVEEALGTLTSIAKKYKHGVSAVPTPNSTELAAQMFRTSNPIPAEEMTAGMAISIPGNGKTVTVEEFALNLQAQKWAKKALDFFEAQIDTPKVIAWANQNQKTDFSSVQEVLKNLLELIGSEEAIKYKPQGYPKAYNIISTLAIEFGLVDSGKHFMKLEARGLYQTNPKPPFGVLVEATLNENNYVSTNGFSQIKELLELSYGTEGIDILDVQTNQPVQFSEDQKKKYREALKTLVESKNLYTVIAGQTLVKVYESLKEKNLSDSDDSKALLKVIQEINPHTLQELLITEHSYETILAQNIIDLLTSLVIYKNPKALDVLFKSWAKVGIQDSVHQALLKLLNTGDDSSGQILAFAETELYGKIPEKAFELIRAAARQNVPGSYEVMERMILARHDLGIQAVNEIFKKQEQGVPSPEKEEVQTRLINEWVEYMEQADELTEDEINFFNRLAYSENFIDLSEIEIGIQDYYKRQDEKRAREEAKQKSESTPPIAWTPFVASTSDDDPQPKTNEELYELITNANSQITDRLNALNLLTARSYSNNEALELLGALPWHVDLQNIQIIDQTLHNLISLAAMSDDEPDNSAGQKAATILDSLIDLCETNYNEIPDRCLTLLELLKSYHIPPYSNMAQDILTALGYEENK